MRGVRQRGEAEGEEKGHGRWCGVEERVGQRGRGGAEGRGGA